MAFELLKRVAELRDELRNICEQRETLDRRFAEVSHALRSLAIDVPNRQEREEILMELVAARRKPGLTERVAQTLRNMPHAYLSPVEVREWVEREGTDLSDYSQPSATISIALSRMARNGRVKVKRKGRNVWYRWNGD